MIASIIIPTCNRTSDLETCLTILIPQLTPNGTVEIIVTDDGSTDSSEQMIKESFPMVHWNRGPRRGPAANRNLGASLAQGSWLIFLDDDCLPVTGYIDAYLKYLIHFHSENELRMFLGPTYRTQEPPSLLWEAPHNPEGSMAISCNLAINKETFEKVGRFDERYPQAAFEDTEFEARFLAQGGKISFVSEARVNHPLRKVPSGMKLAKRWEARVIYALDHEASSFHILWALPLHVTKIIISRFWDKPWTFGNFRAVPLFFREWLLVLWLTPGWINKWRNEPRSLFWSTRVEATHELIKYGF